MLTLIWSVENYTKFVFVILVSGLAFDNIIIGPDSRIPFPSIQLKNGNAAVEWIYLSTVADGDIPCHLFLEFLDENAGTTLRT